MIYTNNHNLPLPAFKAFTTNSYDKGDSDYSVTELNNSPRIAFLKKRHNDVLMSDAMDNLWSMRGTAMHNVMENAEVEGSIIEKRIYIDVLGKKVGAKPDYVWPFRVNSEGVTEYELLDWKDTSYYAIKDGPKDDWVKQLNVYSYGLRLAGVDIRSIRVMAIMRDWSRNDSKFKVGYPQSAVALLEIPQWQDNTIIEMLEQRVALFEDFKDVPDDELPACSREERWARDDVWAVVWSDGATAGRAVPKGGKFATEAEAKAFMTNKGGKRGMRVEYRPGENIRCNDYCACSSVCNQYKSLHNDDF